MKLEDQVCSLELAKRLKELGVRRESAFYWIGHYINTTDCVEKPETARLQLGDYGTEYMWKYPAFTVAELGELLKYKQPASDPRGWWVLWDGDLHAGPFQNESDGRAAMLIHLIEKGIVKP